ncbi:50S ribosomal protein L11 methyltransferase [Candidatus Bathyarchaeota archaeon]|nr:50S ribosomal protein L11 methyltransferase [Candidatus Bathyarchaeota archaeon]
MERIPPRIEIEKMLEKMKPHLSPKVELEQYTTPADIAAELLFTASFIFDDVQGKSIIDLGCGSGRLGIGAKILGAQSVVGIDIDPDAVRTAVNNAKEVIHTDNIYWIIGDISAIRGVFDTVIMNPSFGTKKRHMDVRFLSVSMTLSRVIYSIHKSSSRDFIIEYVRRRGFEVSVVLSSRIKIPRLFEFHRKPSKMVAVDMLRIIRA